AAGPVNSTVEAHPPQRAGAIGHPADGRRDTRGTLIARSPSANDVDTLEGLRALALETALALDGVSMADQLMRQRTEARFQSLVQHSSDAILVVDASGFIDFASPSSDRVLGHAAEDLRGRRLLAPVATADRARVAQAAFAGSKGGTAGALEFRFVWGRSVLEVEAL